MPTKLPLNFISKSTIHHKTPAISHYSSHRSSSCRTSRRRSAAPSCSTRSSAESIRWNGRGAENHHHHHHRVPKLNGAGGSINYGGVDQDGDNKMPRVVHCEVQVVSWRERRIKSEISVNADVDSVWDALTDYECLADFVPNLVSSKYYANSSRVTLS
nr:polyketide cyclase/dehydrase and lipid transporter [Ipomoea batatas]